MRGAKLYIEGGAELVAELRALLEWEGYAVVASYEEADGCICPAPTAPDGEKPCYVTGDSISYYDVLAFAANLSTALWEARAQAENELAKRKKLPTLNPNRRTVRLGDRTVTLTEKEYALFTRLYEARGEAVSREALHRDLWPAGTSPKEVDVYICYLREKLEPVLGAGRIRAVRGVGYRYAE